MFVIYFIFALCTAQGASLNIYTPQNWSVRENFLGFDYVITEKNNGNNSLMIQKTSQFKMDDSLSDKLKKIIFEKKSSPKSPWSEIKTVEELSLKFGNKNNKSKAFVVEYLKDKISFAGIVGVYALDNEFWFLYYADLKEKFVIKKDEIFKILEGIKVQK